MHLVLSLNLRYLMSYMHLLLSLNNVDLVTLSTNKVLISKKLYILSTKVIRGNISLIAYKNVMYFSFIMLKAILVCDLESKSTRQFLQIIKNVFLK